MKKLISVILAILIMASLSVSAFAMEPIPYDKYSNAPMPTLTAEQKHEITDTKASLEKNYGYSITIVEKSEYVVYMQMYYLEEASKQLGASFFSFMNKSLKASIGKKLNIQIGLNQSGMSFNTGDYSPNTGVVRLITLPDDTRTIPHELGHAFKYAVGVSKETWVKLGKGSKYTGDYTDTNGSGMFASINAAADYEEDIAETFAVLVANGTTTASKVAKSNYKAGTTCDAKYQYIKALLIKHIGEDKVVTKQAKKFLGEIE